MYIVDFSISAIAEDYLNKLNVFFDEHIFPNEKVYDEEIDNSDDPLHIPQLLNDLKAVAKKEGLRSLSRSYGYSLVVF